MCGSSLLFLFVTMVTRMLKYKDKELLKHNKSRIFATNHFAENWGANTLLADNLKQVQEQIASALDKRKNKDLLTGDNVTLVAVTKIIRRKLLQISKPWALPT